MPRTFEINRLNARIKIPGPDSKRMEINAFRIDKNIQFNSISNLPLKEFLQIKMIAKNLLVNMRWKNRKKIRIIAKG